METNVKKALVQASGKQIQVYKLKLRDKWCDFSNCKDEYFEHELVFLN